MATLSKAELLITIVSAISNSGWNVLYIADQHPFRLQVYRENQSYRIRIYIWNITHGGGSARPSHEYRIQITGVNHFEPEPGGKTVILGWWDQEGIFAGFDFNRHQGTLGSSPSFQLREECLRQAHETGFSPCLKENQEIAIAFRPDFLVEYISQMDLLHAFGESRQDFDALQQVAIDPDVVNDEDLEAVSEQRRIVVASVQRRLRSSRFRSRVLTAYSHRCAFCGIQLELVQAAHILPITHAESTDQVHNGIAACFLHHAAYDRGLITFDTTYKVVIHAEQMNHLANIKRDGGRDSFQDALRPQILIPTAVADRPHSELVQKANRVRGWKLS